MHVNYSKKAAGLENNLLNRRLFVSYGTMINSAINTTAQQQQAT